MRRLARRSAEGLALLLTTTAAPAFGFDCFSEINPIYLETDVRSLIRAVTPTDVERIRGELISYIWKAPTLPQGLPEVASNVANPFPVLTDLPEGTRIDELTVTLDDFVSRMYLFVPQHARRRLMIVHQGHTQLSRDGTAQAVQLFLRQRHSVLVVHMPLYGPNTGPFGPVPFFHDSMFSWYESPTLSPFKYFLEPVVQALNYAERFLRIRWISMMGLSGGGWTTTLAAAIDPRIVISVPVAGSLPSYLHRIEDPCLSKSRGDIEQHHAELYSIAGYLDLYVLGSYGRRRGQLQVLNQFDRCCFAGVRFLTYRDIVQDVVRGLHRGRYDVFLDASHRSHMISGLALRDGVLPFVKHRRY